MAQETVMSYTFPSTPSKQKVQDSEKQELPSCLKNSGNGKTAPYGHKHSTSQVRFSLPLEPDSDYHSESNCNSGLEELHPFNGSTSSSPSKVVFPKSSDDNLATHFVDFHSKVMVDVPEDIWQFHNDRDRSCKTSSSPTKGHQRTQSLQSMIADTIQSYHPKPSQNIDTSASISTPPRLKPTNLYLKSDSSLNKYQVPVPLEASLPPYLSPENKSKRRNSLIYDGEGYSLFLGDEEDSSFNEQDVSRRESEANTSISHCSDLSIPSATHDYSFDVNEDIDRLLGIDEDANVNLKKQARNLLNRMPNPNEQHPPPFPKPPTFKDSANITRVNGTQEVRESPNCDFSSQSDALKILTSPSKTITIPSFDQIPVPTKNSTLSHFLTKMENEDRDDDISHNHQQSDEMNQTFQFPSPQKDLPENSGSTPSDDFLSYGADSPADNSFERRRKLLIKESSNGKGLRSHTHTRTRSIHNSQDIFSEKNSNENTISTNMDVIVIPERSPKRSQSNNLQMRGEPEAVVSTPTKSTAHYIPKANLSTVALSGAGNIDDSFSYTSSTDCQKGSKDPSHTPTEVLLPPENHSTVSFSSLNSHQESPLSTALGGADSSTSLARDFFCDTMKDPISSASTHNSFDSEDQKPNANSNDSIEVIGENKERPTPLSTYHSFKAPLNLLSDHNQTTFTDIRTTTKDRLSPTRQLSNVMSHSSCESKDSIPSHPSSATAYSLNSYVNSSLFDQVRKKKATSFATGSNANKSNIDDSKPGYLDTSQPQTLKECIGGEMVDVILLDSFDDDTPPPSRRRPKSLHGDALEHHEILALCDETANKAKTVILDLVNITKQPHSKFKSLPRPLTEISSLQSRQKTAAEDIASSARLGYDKFGHVMNTRIAPPRYVSNLEKIRIAEKDR
ncbi:LANO_0D01728g1_1 [Lachancea nothofagi CBS 11611]|uniref:LANO_0D01728g1_1 n=1 Tax=Lachancea nothofagi CBS 11611 TaxID=1266666 RepID=A0A1G4JDN3_9SACH|nr:LANO_0D01728g1_1 [Lachancea nothofagi CBS 11611]